MKRYAGRGFQWSDAWLLLAIGMTAKGRSATLSEVIGAADGINHAIMTHAEVDQGIERLQAARLIEASPAGLSTTEEGAGLVERAGRRRRSAVNHMAGLALLLEAAEHPNTPLAECKGTFVSGPAYHAAVEQHRKSFWQAYRKLHGGNAGKRGERGGRPTSG